MHRFTERVDVVDDSFGEPPEVGMTRGAPGGNLALAPRRPRACQGQPRGAYPFYATSSTIRLFAAQGDVSLPVSQSSSTCCRTCGATWNASK